MSRAVRRHSARLLTALTAASVAAWGVSGAAGSATAASTRAGSITETAAAVSAPAVSNAAKSAPDRAVVKPAPKKPTSPPPLSLGSPNLVEKRSSRTVAPGVNVTSIVRGVTPARASQIATTPYGPWRITVTTIDPKLAKGYSLRTTAGPTLAATDYTTNLAKAVGAVVAMNGGYFAYTRSPGAPGDPAGFMVAAGTVLSEGTGTVGEHDVLINARTMTLRMGQYRWSGAVTAQDTGARFDLDGINRIPPVPAGCATLQDPRACSGPGAMIRFTPQWAAVTPSGPGAEVVLDRRGCVVKVQTVRGVRLTASQWSIQATGAQAGTLLDALPGGCQRYTEDVRDSEGDAVKIDSATYGVTGRYRLLADRQILVPSRTSAFFSRNPRSIIGRTAAGKIALITIDGRQTVSVGATLREAAQVAKSVGLTDAVNLDGGESSTMVVKGQVVNRVMLKTQRKVSDAVVLVRR